MYTDHNALTPFFLLKDIPTPVTVQLIQMGYMPTLHTDVVSVESDILIPGGSRLVPIQTILAEHFTLRVYIGGWIAITATEVTDIYHCELKTQYNELQEYTRRHLMNWEVCNALSGYITDHGTEDFIDVHHYSLNHDGSMDVVIRRRP